MAWWKCLNKLKGFAISRGGPRARSRGRNSTAPGLAGRRCGLLKKIHHHATLILPMLLPIPRDCFDLPWSRWLAGTGEIQYSDRNPNRREAAPAPHRWSDPTRAILR
jgi:hypothetical protein